MAPKESPRSCSGLDLSQRPWEESHSESLVSVTTYLRVILSLITVCRMVCREASRKAEREQFYCPAWGVCDSLHGLKEGSHGWHRKTRAEVEYPQSGGSSDRWQGLALSIEKGKCCLGKTRERMWRCGHGCCPLSALKCGAVRV